MNDYITLDKVAEILPTKPNRSTVWRWCAKGVSIRGTDELVRMRFEHIEKIRVGEIYLQVFGKGDKQRLVPFPAPAFKAYEGYLRYRPECGYQEIFISVHTRRPLSKWDVNNVCDQLARRVELSKKLTPHLLRHTYATHLHLKGQPIEHINALLGHESLNTTKIYVHIDAGKLRRSVEELWSPDR